MDLVKEIHMILSAGTYDERQYIENEERPGEFKKRDYVTGIHEVGSAANEVEADLTELLKESMPLRGKMPSRLRHIFMHGLNISIPLRTVTGGSAGCS